jgi:hypothetical protein
MIKLKRVKASLILAGVFIFFSVFAHDRRPKGPIVGHLQNTAMDETSGIAASKIHPGIFYIHNDSGDSSRFFAITTDGKLKAELKFKGIAENAYHVYDCEDIAVGPGPTIGKSYVYIGDIGDNNSKRPLLMVYRVPEPSFGNDSLMQVDASVLYLKYPDGPKDAETMMIDSVGQLLYIVTKRKGSVSVYSAPLNQNPTDTVTMTKHTDIHFSGLQPLKWIVGGDISADGKQILLKSYINVYYWKRDGNEPIWQTLTRKPQKLNYKREKQGEAIAFAPDGKAYYTISEGTNAPIYKYNTP